MKFLVQFILLFFVCGGHFVKRRRATAVSSLYLSLYSQFRLSLFIVTSCINIFFYYRPQIKRSATSTPFLFKKIGRAGERRRRAEARLRGKIPAWTGPIQPKLHHNTREGKREAFLRRPLVEPSIVPTGPLPSREQQEEWERRRRLDYIQRGLERGYPLLEDPT